MSEDSSPEVENLTTEVVPCNKKRKSDALDDSNEEGQGTKCSYQPKPVPDEDGDDGTTCPICFDSWSSTGDHRISSLKCGHFFGFECIDKWLRNGNDCPNCNDKATRRDIRPHYVKKLVAIDTGEKDRALKDLAETKKELRSLQLEHAALKVTCQCRKEEIEKLQEEIRLLRSGLGQGAVPLRENTLAPRPSSSSSSYSRLVYLKRSELFRRDTVTPENIHVKYCKVMVYNETHGMLIVSQPSFTALAPGFGVRRVNMLDRRVESFTALHKEPIRDLAINPVFQDQLLSVSQDKTARLTNISNCTEIHRWHLESEVWSCAWDHDNPNIFFVGTKRSEILVFDTRATGSGPLLNFSFPTTERRPIISMCFVPKQPSHASFPCSGLLVQTLGSLWFFEFTNLTEETEERRADFTYKVHKLNLGALFWSLKFDLTSRLLLVSTKPQAHARHIVCELSRINVSEDPAIQDFQISTNIIMDQNRGGSYADRSFLRSAICPKPGDEKQILVLYGRGSSQTDHKLILQEVGNDRVIQEIPVDRPIMDVCTFSLNGDHFVTVLCESELYIYKWGILNA